MIIEHLAQDQGIYHAWSVRCWNREAETVMALVPMSISMICTLWRLSLAQADDF